MLEKEPVGTDTNLVDRVVGDELAGWLSISLGGCLAASAPAAALRPTLSTPSPSPLLACRTIALPLKPLLSFALRLLS
jgi:hypothetical protein